jgi:hypothetical protein
MSYRKITVDGKVYEYTVGRTHTKIKGVGVFENINIGDKNEMHCECCGETLNELYGEDESHYSANRSVKPNHIKKCIEDTIAA